MKNEWKVYDHENEEVASGPYLICERDNFFRLKVSKDYDKDDYPFEKKLGRSTKPASVICKFLNDDIIK